MGRLVPLQRGATTHQTRRAEAAEAIALAARARLDVVAGHAATAARVAAIEPMLAQLAAAARVAEAWRADTPTYRVAAVDAMDDAVDAAAIAAALLLRDAQETAFAAGALAVPVPGGLHVTLAEMHRAGGGEHHLHVVVNAAAAGGGGGGGGGGENGVVATAGAGLGLGPGMGASERLKQRPIAVPVGGGGGAAAPWWGGCTTSIQLDP
jgi:hypothetical protein